MKLLHEIYFSPTGTTQKIVNTIASSMNHGSRTDHNLPHSDLKMLCLY